MANQAHLQFLQAGALTWWEWRHHYPEIIPDLQGADLQRINLRGANLLGR